MSACRITTETQGYFIGRHYCHTHDIHWDGAFAVGGGCPRTEEPAPDPYPQHTKLRAVHEESQAQGEFVEWAMDRGYLHRGLTIALVDALAEYHGIDLGALEKEKRAMLAAIQEVQ